MIERFSYSSLESYKKCPMQFKLRYLDKIRKKDEGIEAFVGNRVHETLEFLYNEKIVGRSLLFDKVIDKYNQNWEDCWHDKIVVVRKEVINHKTNWVKTLAGRWESAREKKSVKEFYKLGESCLSGYYRKFYPFDQPAIGTEVEFTFALDKSNNYIMKGIADRIDHDGNGNYEIHDYKTGKRMMSQKDADNDSQLATYQIPLEKRWFRFWRLARLDNIKSIKLVWHFLQHNELVFSQRDKVQMEELVHSTKLKIDEIRDHIKKGIEFQPKESILCNWCHYWEECPAKSTNNDIL